MRKQRIWRLAFYQTQCQADSNKRGPRRQPGDESKHGCPNYTVTNIDIHMFPVASMPSAALLHFKGTGTSRNRTDIDRRQRWKLTCKDDNATHEGRAAAKQLSLQRAADGETGEEVQEGEA